MKSLSREQKDQLIANMRRRAARDKFFEILDASLMCMDFVSVPDDVMIEVMQSPADLTRDFMPGIAIAASTRKMRWAPWKLDHKCGHHFLNIDGDTSEDALTVKLAREWANEINVELQNDLNIQKQLNCEKVIIWGPYLMPHIIRTNPNAIPPGFSGTCAVAMYRYAKKVI